MEESRVLSHPPGAARGTPLQRLFRPARATQWLWWCDALTEAALYAMVIGGPWLFGTTHRWAIWTLTGVAYGLGFLLGAKWTLRYLHRRGGSDGASPPRRQSRRVGAWLTAAMAVLTGLVLLYVLIGAINAAATYHYGEFHLESRPHLAWLPHSFDRASTWFCFWQYLGLAALFWATRDWVLHADGWAGARAQAVADPGLAVASSLPPHLRRLLLVLGCSGSLLALEGIVQRLFGADRLLFVVTPNFPARDMVFGPYAYRGNASQYLNLVWPVTAAVAWLLARDRRRADRAGLRPGMSWHVGLTLGTVLMAVAPLVSLCRGGAMVAGAQALVLGSLLLAASRRRAWPSRLGYLLLILVALQTALVLGWDRFSVRLETVLTDRLSGRLDTFERARKIVEDYPVLGTGPGSFALVYKFYRPEEKDYWAAQAHNDWLETRITFGALGLGLILALLVLVPLTWVGTTGLRVHWLLAATLLLALTGCLVHARFDFPLQIHSILALFLVEASVLTCLGRGPRGRARP